MNSEHELKKRQQRTSRRVNKGPTVADVARLAGVSPMTVSRVVNRETKVTEETRKKVEKAIADLGYVPNAAARSLAGRQHCRLALLHSNPSAAYLSEFLMGSIAGARDADAEIIVEHCRDDDSPAELVERLVRHRIDAVLLPPPLCEDGQLLSQLEAAGLTFAQIAAGTPSDRAVAIRMDDREAARVMTTHLLGQGHRRVGFIRGDANQTSSNLRCQGYQLALEADGLPLDPGLIVNGDFTYRSGMDAAEKLLALPSRPTAIFASNDDMAAAVIAVVHRHGLEVPRDISVVGFDDSAMACTIWPQITTIRQPVAAMARRATTALAEVVRSIGRGGSAEPVHEILSFELVQRDSDAPPASRA
jgi:LacI family transcriptional regulator